jgi:hypothetical protein
MYRHKGKSIERRETLFAKRNMAMIGPAGSGEIFPTRHQLFLSLNRFSALDMGREFLLGNFFHIRSSELEKS